MLTDICPCLIHSRHSYLAPTCHFYPHGEIDVLVFYVRHETAATSILWMHRRNKREKMGTCYTMFRLSQSKTRCPLGPIHQRDMMYLRGNWPARHNVKRKGSVQHCRVGLWMDGKLNLGMDYRSVSEERMWSYIDVSGTDKFLLQVRGNTASVFHFIYRVCFIIRTMRGYEELLYYSWAPRRFLHNVTLRLDTHQR